MNEAMSCKELKMPAQQQLIGAAAPGADYAGAGA
jgi:hypothetical protein